MFKKLKEYAKTVKEGKFEQVISVRNAKPTINLSPENSYYENHGKYMEIKDYIESHMHGVTVNVSGGEKVLSEDGDYTRRPIVIRTFKNNEPYVYNEIKTDGMFMDEKDGAMCVYDTYIGFFIDGSEYIKTGTVSPWEQFISRWLSDNNFNEQGYYCENNQLFKFDEDTCEIIVSDITREVIGVADTDIRDIDSEYETGLVIICRDKQVLIGYENYFIMKEE